MKALSIKEPFASLISLNIKHIETRSWKTNYRGEIYIHASLSKYDSKDVERMNKLKSLLPDDYEFKRGKIICKAYLSDCIYMDDTFIESIKKDEIEYLCGNYSLGRYAWVLKDVKMVDEIPIKGKLGIWNFEI